MFLNSREIQWESGAHCARAALLRVFVVGRSIIPLVCRKNRRCAPLQKQAVCFGLSYHSHETGSLTLHTARRDVNLHPFPIKISIRKRQRAKENTLIQFRTLSCISGTKQQRTRHEMCPCVLDTNVCVSFSLFFLLLRCLWKRREVVLELQWFCEQQDLWFSWPPHKCHPPYQPSTK